MDRPRPCGCKGCRVCLLCEKEFGLETKDFQTIFKNYQNQFVFCPECNKCYRGWNVTNVQNEHPKHNDEIGHSFPGIFVQTNFLNESESTGLMNGMDELPWDISQSGRRKQNFGPKTNFKKMKLKSGEFNGFPKFSEFVQQRFQTIPLLCDFQSIEQCSLEYDPCKGASIDPHIDDCWIWGERVVTVNCLGDSVLTLNKYNGDRKRYNLPLVDDYKSHLRLDLNEPIDLDEMNEVVVRVPMPNRSLIVMFGPPRYRWEHSVLREDINSRRVCIAYREFTPEYLENGLHYDKSADILRQAKQFWNH